MTFNSFAHPPRPVFIDFNTYDTYLRDHETTPPMSPSASSEKYSCHPGLVSLPVNTGINYFFDKSITPGNTVDTPISDLNLASSYFVTTTDSNICFETGYVMMEIVGGFMLEKTSQTTAHLVSQWNTAIAKLRIANDVSGNYHFPIFV